MNVGVGDLNRRSFHVDHDHVRVRDSDIVLDHQPAAGASSRGTKTGMVEFERRGSIDAGHERSDQRTVRVFNSIHRGAVQPLLGQVRLHGIQTLVQVHHKLMNAILLAPAACDFVNERAANQIAGRRTQVCQ